MAMFYLEQVEGKDRNERQRQHERAGEAPHENAVDAIGPGDDRPLGARQHAREQFAEHLEGALHTRGPLRRVGLALAHERPLDAQQLDHHATAPIDQRLVEAEHAVEHAALIRRAHRAEDVRRGAGRLGELQTPAGLRRDQPRQRHDAVVPARVGRGDP